MPVDVRILVLVLVGLWVDTTRATEEPQVRLASGRVIEGKVLAATVDGLQVETPRGTVELPWYTLSPGTRYRYDEAFRNAFPRVLRGLPIPPARELPKAEPRDGPTRRGSVPDKSSPAEPPAPAREVIEPRQPGSRLWKYVTFEEAPLIRGTDLPFRVPPQKIARYWGLQYGPTQNDVLYFIMVYDRAGQKYDRAWAYAPAAAELRAPVKLRGMRKRTADWQEVTYPEIGLSASFGPLRVQYGIVLRGHWDEAEEWTCEAQVRLKLKGMVSHFTAWGQIAPAAGSDPVPIHLLPDQPMLNMSVNVSGTAVTLDGSVRMGRFRLIPGRGMSRLVELTVTDSSGTTVYTDRKRLGHGETKSRYRFAFRLEGLQSGQRYRAIAELDLGPILGTVSVMRKLRMRRR
ncbi:MAG TPA: hypothetical protein EYP62_07765 [Kiritimatiellae bacterium]|nr:hypothetical protein [Kiritimatiellia bacterium]